MPETKTTSGDLEYAGSDWSWETTVSETGIEGLLRIDVAVTRPGIDGNIRSVTGFAGEPTLPGQANRIWISGSVGAGGSDDDNDDQGVTN